MGSFFAGDRMEDDMRWREERERRLAKKKEMHADETDTTPNEADGFQEKDDEDIYFAPERGNVIFASAIDGWGFRVGKFAQLYAVKLQIKEANLRRVLWGDFFLDPKTKKVISYKHLRGRILKPLFVQFVLENIWAVYDAVVLNQCVSFSLMCHHQIFRSVSQKYGKGVQDCDRSQFEDHPPRPKVKGYSSSSVAHLHPMVTLIHVYHSNRDRRRSSSFSRSGYADPKNTLP
jgi:translation elongation factor EF-G